MAAHVMVKSCNGEINTRKFHKATEHSRNSFQIISLDDKSDDLLTYELRTLSYGKYLGI